MLFTETTEEQIITVMGALSAGAAAYLIGRDLGQSVIQATTSAISGRSLTMLEQSFLAGKLAQKLGPNRLKGMSEEDIIRLVKRTNLTLTRAEIAHLDNLRRGTQSVLRSSNDVWVARFRAEFAQANNSWRAELAATPFKDAQARTLARNSALKQTIFALTAVSEKFKPDFGRVVQTEMARYFQEGQVGGLPGDELVYKIPRYSACPYCFNLHVDSEGAPRIYRLEDVRENSNWKLKASSWKFTIGPVHPHCYCILYRVKDQPVPKPNKALREARKKTLKKALNLEFDNECGVTGPHQTFEDLVESGTKETPPAFVEPLLKAVRNLDIPVC